MPARIPRHRHASKNLRAADQLGRCDRSGRCVAGIAEPDAAGGVGRLLASDQSDDAGRANRRPSCPRCARGRFVSVARRARTVDGRSGLQPLPGSGVSQSAGPLGTVRFRARLLAGIDDAGRSLDHLVGPQQQQRLRNRETKSLDRRIKIEFARHALHRMAAAVFETDA